MKVNRKSVRSSGPGRAERHTVMVAGAAGAGAGNTPLRNFLLGDDGQSMQWSEVCRSAESDGFFSFSCDCQIPTSIAGRRGERRGRIRSGFSTLSSTSKGRRGADRVIQSSTCARE